MLLCGSAKSCITPGKEFLENLRGLMGKKFVAVEDDIYVRVLALKLGDRTWLICGFDLDKAPNPQSSIEAISREFDIQQEYITFYGIHTHTAPALGNRSGEGFNNVKRLSQTISETTEQYEQYVFEKLRETVRAALDGMIPANVRYGRTLCGCNVNRCMDFYSVDEQGNLSLVIQEDPNPLGPVDHYVYVIQFEAYDGRFIGFLVNYAVHNTVMFMNSADSEGNCAVSADLGGNVSKMIENRFPETVALWCSGVAGNVAPLRPSIRMHQEPDEENYQFSYRQKKTILKQMCANHYAAVMEALNELSDPLNPERISAGVYWTKTPSRTILRDEDSAGKTVHMLSVSDDAGYFIRLHLTKLGTMLVIGIGGELYSTYALMLQERYYQLHVIVINHDASMIRDAGYIVDDETWDRIDYLPLSSCRLPGTPPRFEKGYVAQAIFDAVDAFLAESEEEQNG
ncbi:MAG: hypothetical protein LUG61_00560 [Lachnospiraceae bacterium]|nr:hypothetical protein [Lachnospiraceae bacterium]